MITKTYISKLKSRDKISYTLKKHAEDTVMLMDSTFSASTLTDFVIYAGVKIQRTKGTRSYFGYRVKTPCYGRDNTHLYSDILIHRTDTETISRLLELCQ